MFPSVPNHNADILTPNILRHIRSSFGIWTDFWRRYSQLTNLSYTLYQINHSSNFRDPITDVCTNIIEGYFQTSWCDRITQYKRISCYVHVVECLWSNYIYQILEYQPYKRTLSINLIFSLYIFLHFTYNLLLLYYTYSFVI